MTAVETNTMKLSKRTIDILKNYATINPNLCISQGNTIYTLAPTKTIMSNVTIPETFSEDVRIFDLNRFLSTISLLQNPEITLCGDHLIISGDGGARVKYWYGDPAIVQEVKQRLSMPKVIAKIDISAKRLAEIIKASSVMQLPNLTFRTNEDGDGVDAILHDKKEPSSNEFTVSLPCESFSDERFSVSYKVESLKIIPGDYTLEIGTTVVSRFTLASEPHEALSYYIAAEFNKSRE